MSILIAQIIAISVLMATHASAAGTSAGTTCSKAGAISRSATKKFTCIKSGNKLIWDKGVAVRAPSPTHSATPVPTKTFEPTPASSPTPSAKESTIYSAKDRSDLRYLVAPEGCANPNKTIVTLQAFMDKQWIQIKSEDSGWNKALNSCPTARLGEKNSLAWVKVYLDTGVRYRWYFVGEVDILHHDALGNGYSESLTIPAPKIVVTPRPAFNKYGLSWVNISSRVKDISAAAYTEAQLTISQNLNSSSVVDNFTTYISPGARNLDPAIDESISLMKKDFLLYADFPHAKQTFFIASTLEEKDQTYASINNLYPSDPFMQNSYDNLYGINPNEPAGSAYTVPKCVGDDPGRNTVTWKKIGEASAVVWSICPTINRAHLEAHHGAAHEYIHNLQAQIYDGKTGIYQPCWMSEGEAEWSQTAVSDDFSTYISFQHFHPYYQTGEGLNFSQPSQTKWTAAEIEAYFQEANKISSCRLTPTYALAYSAGTAAIEALVALGGSESFFSLDQRLANNENFEKAFNEVYGVSWGYAEPILADVVAQKLTHANQPDASTYQTRP